jgi:hypothetical protein
VQTAIHAVAVVQQQPHRVGPGRCWISFQDRQLGPGWKYWRCRTPSELVGKCHDGMGRLGAGRGRGGGLGGSGWSFHDNLGLGRDPLRHQGSGVHGFCDAADRE